MSADQVVNCLTGPIYIYFEELGVHRLHICQRFDRLDPEEPIFFEWAFTVAASASASVPHMVG